MRLLALSGLSILIVATHFAISRSPVTVLVINRAPSAQLVLQVNDTSYAVAPGSRPAVSVRGQLTHQLRLLSDRCAPLQAVVASAGDAVTIEVLSESSITVETGQMIETAQTSTALLDPPCPSSGPSLETVARNALLVVAVLTGILGKAFAIRSRQTTASMT
jgi:hypothetical protein